jgi:hypothetical protein
LLEPEEALLGSLLLPGSQAWERVAGVVTAGDFARREHGLIFQAVSELAAQGEPHDAVLVAAHLERSGQLEAVGGLADLSALVRLTPTADNVLSYAAKMLEKADRRRLLALFARAQTEIASGARPGEIASAVRSELEGPEARGGRLARNPMGFKRLRTIAAEDREPDWLLHPILEAAVLALLIGPPGSFKSFIALHWAMLIAMSGKNVCLLSAEGAGLSKRVLAWMKAKAPNADIPENAIALERIVNLDSDQTLEQVSVDLAGEDFRPDLIVVDTYSKYAAGLDESSPPEVAAFLARLATGLKDRYGCTVLMVAHTGVKDQDRARGTNTLKANTDAEYIVTVNDAKQRIVSVSCERFKDCGSKPPLTYRMDLVDLGRVDKYGDRHDSLVPVDTDAPPPIADQQPTARSKNDRLLLKALRARTADDSGRIWTIEELRKIGRELGMHKNTARDVADRLTLSPHMQGTVGGWKLKGPDGPE